ncbi:hypothetical protein EDB19DRAFT_2028959 [Suillus lakei]|nr:hypothetical protein EDB19DRAFT_2028959 [Suillus lakei]
MLAAATWTARATSDSWLCKFRSCKGSLTTHPDQFPNLLTRNSRKRPCRRIATGYTVPGIGDVRVTDHLVTQLAKILHNGSQLYKSSMDPSRSDSPSTDTVYMSDDSGDSHDFEKMDRDIGTTAPEVLVPRERFSFCGNLIPLHAFSRSEAGFRECAYRLFSGCPNLIMDVQTDAVLTVFRKGLQDSQSVEVRLAALQASVSYFIACLVVGLMMTVTKSQDEENELVRKAALEFMRSEGWTAAMVRAPLEGMGELQEDTLDS